MSSASLLCALLSVQACCAFGASAVAHIAADGTVSNFEAGTQLTDVTDLLAEVEDMAKTGDVPDGEKVKTIDELIDELLPTLMASRDKSQEEVHDNVEAVKKCNDDQAASITKIESGIKKETNDYRQEHLACRKEEKEIHHTHKVKKCTELTTYLNEIEEKSPEQPNDADDDDAMVEWVGAMSDNWCDAGKVANEKETACKKATKAHADHKEKCDKLQDQFELGFCTWRTRLIDTCEAQNTCYADALTAYKDHKAATEELVKRWKVEYVALKKMSCYINLWLSHDFQQMGKDSKTAASNKLEECKALSPDKSVMEVTFPNPPAKTECSLDEVKNYPGTPTFRSTEYADYLNPMFVKEPTHCLITEPEPTKKPPTPVKASPATGGGYLLQDKHAATYKEKLGQLLETVLKKL